MLSTVKVYGPYLNGKRARLIVVKIDDEGNYSSQSYPRFLMEQHLGRQLRSDEEVHHIDGDKSNNDLSNLEVLTGEEHKKRHGHRPGGLHQCQHCGKLSKKTKSRKFCSPQCYAAASRKVERPAATTLKNDLSSMSWTAVGRKYGVSDNAVRKWARSYGISRG